MQNNPVQITRNPAQTKIEPVETGNTIVLTKREIQMFDALANILEYPVRGWAESLRNCVELLNSGGYAGPEHLFDFSLQAKQLTLLELQELYTRTFDLNPVCALEIGYHLFGEDYKRGEFLARLRETENPYELAQDKQLPDYLPVVLRLLGKMEDAELRASLIGYCLLPALKKMNRTFEKGANPYGHVFRFLTEFLIQIAESSLTGVRTAANSRYQYA